MVLHLVHCEHYHEYSEAPKHVAVEIGLSENVWGVADSLALSEHLITVHTTEQEGVFGGQAEHVKLVFVISKFGWALAERAAGSKWQSLATDLVSSVILVMLH